MSSKKCFWGHFFKAFFVNNRNFALCVIKCN